MGGLFDDLNLIGGEGVEVVDEGVDLMIGGGDLGLEGAWAIVERALG